MWVDHHIIRKYHVVYYDEALYEIEGSLYDISDELDEASQYFKDNYVLRSSECILDRPNGMLYFRMNPAALTEYSDEILKQEEKLKEVLLCDTCAGLPVKKIYCLDCNDLKSNQQQAAKVYINDARADGTLHRMDMRPDFIREIKKIFPDSEPIASKVAYHL